MSQAAEDVVPAVALQSFLHALQTRKFEKAKALAFQSACCAASVPCGPFKEDLFQE